MAGIDSINGLNFSQAPRGGSAADQSAGLCRAAELHTAVHSRFRRQYESLFLAEHRAAGRSCQRCRGPTARSHQPQPGRLRVPLPRAGHRFRVPRRSRWGILRKQRQSARQQRRRSNKQRRQLHDWSVRREGLPRTARQSTGWGLGGGAVLSLQLPEPLRRKILRNRF
jgi:hypothetical protein